MDCIDELLVRGMLHASKVKLARVECAEDDMWVAAREALRVALVLRINQHSLPLLRGGGDDSLDEMPTPQPQRSRDDAELVQSLRERLRLEGARASDEENVKVALVLARDYAPSFKPDKAFWLAHCVPEGGARTRVRKLRQRILDEHLLDTAPEPSPRPLNPRYYFAKGRWYPFLITADDLEQCDFIDTHSDVKEGTVQLQVWCLGTRYLWLSPAATDDEEGMVRFKLEDAYRMATAAEDAAMPLALPPPPPQVLAPPPPSLEEQADAVEAEIQEHEEAIADAEAHLRPLRRRLRYINHQRFAAAWKGLAGDVTGRGEDSESTHEHCADE